MAMGAIAALCLLAAGCGRRGALEAPPGATAPAVAPTASSTKAGGRRAVQTEGKTAQAPQSSATPTLSSTEDAPEDETLDANDTGIGPAQIPTPAAPGTRRRGRNFTIPKEPFVLDPIL